MGAMSLWEYYWQKQRGRWFSEESWLVSWLLPSMELPSRRNLFSTQKSGFRRAFNTLLGSKHHACLGQTRFEACD